jgi:BASS family bile acid:Na+ symporter
MNVDRLINLLVTLTLVAMMTGIGLGVDYARIAAVVRNRNLLLRAGIANYVCVPAITIGLLLWFHSPPLIAAGFLIVAVCPGAPYGPPLTALAGGDTTAATGLMVVLAGSSAIVGPLLLRLLLPLLAAGYPLKVSALRMIETLLVSQLLPLAVGIALRHRRPGLARKLKQPLDRVSALLGLVVLGLILVNYVRILAAIRFAAYAGMLTLALGSTVSGWLLGGPGADHRKAMAFSTAVRNVALSLVIATASFAETPAVTAALAYGVLQTVAIASLALAWSHVETAARTLRAGWCSMGRRMPGKS